MNPNSLPELQPVILSGGSGTRLWPASRSMYPKQLLPLTGDETMLQQTAKRLIGMQETSDDCVVICNEAHRFLVAEQTRQIGRSARVVLEPAMSDRLVTFGIVPTRPETGYGYVRAKPSGDTAVPVESFVERPDLETARQYVDSGEYF